MKPRKNEKRRSSLKVSPTAIKNKKEKLLARWTNGLFYFVKVIKVSEANQTCSVEFEDKSTTQVHFKDLLEVLVSAHDDGDTECHFCGEDSPAENNAMVTCSNCERVYHQHCHVPQVGDNELGQKFVCRICVFASCAQTGGAKTTGHLAEKFAVMKHSFPYELKCLTWDATHTSNVEQSFCYCGGPGCWYNKMLQCCRCRQWFHEACLQCLKEQLLVGDHFYVFACAHCNQGKEFLQRMDMKWADFVYVSLFHLTMTLSARFVDIEDIVTCVMNHGSSFRLKDMLNGHHANWSAVQERVVTTLRDNNHVFICAAELRKKNTLYGLRERVPRAPQSYSVPAPGEKITKESLLQTSSSSKSVTFSPSKLSSPVVLITRGIKKLPTSSGSRVRESKMVKLARVKSEHNYCTPLKCPERQRKVCRSDSPSSTTSGSSSNSSSDLADLGLYDSNNNTSPSKQPLPQSSPSPSPPLPRMDSPTVEKNGEESRKGKKEEMREVENKEERSSKTGRGRRSRSSSSTREVRQEKTSAVRANGKNSCYGKVRRGLNTYTEEESKAEISIPDLDMTPPSPYQEDLEIDKMEADTKPFWSLETAFPQPASFSGADHPFLTEFEQDNLRRKQRHFEQELGRLALVLESKSSRLGGGGDEVDGMAFSSPSAQKSGLSSCVAPAPGLKDITGFKGELSSLIQTPPVPQPRVNPATSSAPRQSSSGARSGSQSSQDSGISSSSRTSGSDSLSPDRLTPKSRRNLRAVNSGETNCGGVSAVINDDAASTCWSSQSSSTPTAAPLCVNGVKISPIMLSKLSPKNGLVSPSAASTDSFGNINSKSSPASLTNSGGSRSGRLQRAAADGSRERGGFKSSLTSRKAKESEKAELRRLSALKRCLKNLSPTCGFHFPVLEQSHPAVANSDTLSSSSSQAGGKCPQDSHQATGLSSCNEDSSKINGSSSYATSTSPCRSSATPASSSSLSSVLSYQRQSSTSSSPLQVKPVNGSMLHKTEGGVKRGRKRKFAAEISDKRGRNVALADQENVRRSHRSRCTVDRFQAALEGRGLMSSSLSSSQTSGHNIADQYDVISLRVGWTGKVEYLINWGD